MVMFPTPKNAVLLVDGDFRLVRVTLQSQSDRSERDMIQHRCDASIKIVNTEYSFEGWSYCWLHQKQADNCMSCMSCMELVPPLLSGFRKMVDWVP